jgi:hypothetical protein
MINASLNCGFAAGQRRTVSLAETADAFRAIEQLGVYG